jgi:hypothetical protein
VGWAGRTGPTGPGPSRPGSVAPSLPWVLMWLCTLPLPLACFYQCHPRVQDGGSPRMKFGLLRFNPRGSSLGRVGSGTHTQPNQERRERRRKKIVQTWWLWANVREVWYWRLKRVWIAKFCELILHIRVFCSDQLVEILFSGRQIWEWFC